MGFYAPKKKKEPVTIEAALRKWMKEAGLDQGWKKFKVFSAWNQIASEKMQKNTEATRFQRQVLEITVHSPGYYFELVNFQKDSLLKKLQEECKDVFVKDIRFVCSGVVNVARLHF